MAFYVNRGTLGNLKKTIKIGKFTLETGVAKHPIQPGCSKSIFGKFSLNKWEAPHRGLMPCPTAVLQRTSSRYTLSFEYKPVKIDKRGNMGIFKIMSKDAMEKNYV